MDWAALAKQWIAQKDAVTTLQGEGPPGPPPPPPPGDGGQGDSMDIVEEGDQKNNGEQARRISVCRSIIPQFTFSISSEFPEIKCTMNVVLKIMKL